MTKDRKKAKVTYYQNTNGPTIGVTAKGVIKQDNLYFKDSNGDGQLSIYKDWRNPAKSRAKDLVKELSVDEKIGLIFINSLKMGIFQEDQEQVDETGLLDEKYVEKNNSIFAMDTFHGTTYTIQNMGVRHFILRDNPKPDQLVDWMNELNYVAEQNSHAIPVLMASNSRNENGEMVFGMNDAVGVFAAWPGTMGIAAAIKGDNIDLIDTFGACIREEWDAVGMKKGYMYMADVMTDPRWQRTYGSFGEDPVLISEIFKRLIPQVQGSGAGITRDGIAMTIKHFPGGGARENGFDPHYKQGQWNVYQTENSLQKYHLPAFQTAIEQKAASIMPYYAKPAAEKSQPQYDQLGNLIDMKPVGFAFNDFFINELLRTQMGFEGYVNSDSGIISKMAWGVEALDTPERIALALNSGVDIISGSHDVESAKMAYERGLNGYYTTQGHLVPEGYTVTDITLSEEVLSQAVERTLVEMFELGLFDNPYRNPQEALKIVDNPVHWEEAYKVHQKSVVLLKNEGQTLPLTIEKLANQKVYIESFHSQVEVAEKVTQKVRKEASEKFGLKLTDDYMEADYAILFVNPSSGNYFNATQGYLELDICEDKEVVDVDELGRPTSTTHQETTLINAGKIQTIAEAVHQRGGKVISNINFTLAWQVGNVEQHSDVLLAGFDTYSSATLDVIVGNVSPTGKLPITLPKNDEVLSVDAQGMCVSPNDVPGYDKDLYMPESMKDAQGKAYTYKDSTGHYYEMNFGLTYHLG